jgi:hypothetical protein
MHYRKNVGFFGRNEGLSGRHPNKPKSTLLTHNGSRAMRFAVLHNVALEQPRAS